MTVEILDADEFQRRPKVGKEPPLIRLPKEVTMSETVPERADDARDELDEAGDDAAHTADHAKDEAADGLERMKDGARDVADKVSDGVEELIPGDSDRDGH